MCSCAHKALILQCTTHAMFVQKMTTNQRANAAIEQYWLRRVPEVRTGAL